jgi:DNA-binding NarL/FixJ family response regulator
MPDLVSMPAARQTVTMKARLAAAGLMHASRPSGPPAPDGTENVPASARVSAARSRARERVDRQRQLLRPVGWVLIAIVVTAGLNSHPAPGLSGVRLGVSLALAGYAVAVAATVAVAWARRGYLFQVLLIGLIGGCGVALAALQPHGPAEIAASVGVWIAAVRLPLRPAIVATVLITGALAVTIALTQQPAAQPALAATLLCLLLAMTGQFIRRGRESQDRTELLMAQLQDAREAEAAAAALAERSRIAGELHDVLAHALSGLAIQLQGARKLADREAASSALRAALERSADLAKEGLADARQAVGALRGDRLPTVDQVGALVEDFRRDTGAEATLRIDGTPPPAARRREPGAIPRRSGGAHQRHPLRAGHLGGRDRALRTGPDDSRGRGSRAADWVTGAGGTGCARGGRRPRAGGSRQRSHRESTARRGRRRARAHGDAGAGNPGGRQRAGRAHRRRVARGTGGPRVTTAPPGRIRVLIADDQRVVRDGLSMLVSLIDEVEVVGLASDGTEAVRLAEEHRPDVILMDLRMPGVDGATATAEVRQRLPGTQVLVLTTYADEAAILAALRAGALGYLTKDASAEQIEAAVRAVHAGQTHLDPAVQARLVATVTGRGPAPGPASDQAGHGGPPPAGLTSREAEVLTLLASGLSNAEIAQRLFLSNATVKTHINRIFAKTGARDRAQAVRFAYQHGLATPAP